MCCGGGAIIYKRETKIKYQYCWQCYYNSMLFMICEVDLCISVIYIIDDNMDRHNDVLIINKKIYTERNLNILVANLILRLYDDLNYLFNFIFILIQ